MRWLLICGVSSRLTLDSLHRAFFELTVAQIATAIANARAYEQERKRAEALAEVDRAKTLFFSNVSHEFRTPLTLMLGPLEDLLRGPEELKQPQREQLGVAHRNSLRLLKLVNTLLDFSRIEAGRSQPRFQETDLSSFTADLASMFRSAMEKAGLIYTVDCPRLPRPALIDRDMWEKIVLNLLSNAFKFTPSGEVRVSLRAHEGMVLFTVHDTGTGIPSWELPNIFKRFHRIENTHGRTQEGTGIGLALAQELVKLHGGTIEVESKLGAYTIFRVRVPLGDKSLTPTATAARQPSTALRAETFIDEAVSWLPKEAQEIARKQQEEISTPVASDGQIRARILLAEDNADMREYVCRLLRSQYEVDAVSNGTAALEAARMDHPDLVVSDIMMPGMSGIELLGKLRSDESMKNLPVILLSARAGEEARIEGMSHGADDYLTKPFTASESLARVANHLQLARVRRESMEALHKSEARFRGLIEQAADGIFLAERDGRYLEVNPAGCSMLRMTRDEVLASSFVDVVAPEERHRIQETVESFADGKVQRSEWRFRRKDGSVFIGELAARQLPDGRLQGVVRNTTERKQAEALLESEKRVLELIASGATLAQMLETLVREVEASSNEGMMASVLLADEKGERLLHGAAPSLPEAYSRAIDGISIGPCAGSCGTAAYRRQPVFAVDIATDPLWADFKNLAAAHGLGACCSTPIVSRQGRLLGTLAMYYRRPHVPGQGERKLIERASHLAAIVIERDQTEEALRRKEEEIRLERDYAEATLRTSPVPLLVLENDLRVRTGNQAFYLTFQVTPSETEGRIVYDLGNGQWNIPELRDLLENILPKHSLFTHFEITHDFESIGRRTMLLNARRMEDEPVGRSPERIVLVIEDITERKRAEQRVQESEERFRMLADNMSQLAWTCDQLGNVTWYNERWYEYTGTTFEEMKDWGWRKVQHPDHVERVVACVTHSRETGEAWEDTFPLRSKTGEYRWFLSRAVPIRDQNGGIIRWFGTNTDITDQRNAELALQEAKHHLEADVRERTLELQERNAALQKQSEDLQSLSANLLQAQDTERRRIARELHDSAGQVLAAIGMNLAPIIQHTSQNSPKLARQAEECQQLVQQLNQEIRTMCYLLHPPLLDESGLSGALRWYIGGLMERSGIRISLRIPEDFGRLPREMEMAMFRIVQECLTNVHRHSGAKSALICVAREGETISLRVQDDGKGISPERLAEIQTHGAGVGTRGMRERVHQLRGHMNIDSNRCGTSVSVAFPAALGGDAQSGRDRLLGVVKDDA